MSQTCIHELQEVPVDQEIHICNDCINKSLDNLTEYHEVKYGKYLATSSDKITWAKNLL